MHIGKFFGAKTRLTSGAALLLASAGLMLLGAPQAHAQLSSNTTVGAIRLGVFTPTNTNTRKTYGKYYAMGGLDYQFSTQGITGRDIISVDYMEYGSHGTDIRVIPVTIGQQVVSNASDPNTMHPYAGYGIGMYFVHLKDPNSTTFGGGDTENNTSFGGYVNVGLDFTHNLFVDARYHLISSAEHVDPSGLELTAGFRF